MAEFCFECWNKMTGSNLPVDKYILSEDLDLCEECGQIKHIVISQSIETRTSPKGRDFGAFWLFVESRRQPYFLLSTKNHHKIPHLLGRRILRVSNFLVCEAKTQLILSD